MSVRKPRNLMGIGSLLVLSCAAACAGWADDFHFESAGVRFGLGAEGPVSQFHQAEAFADWNLPWAWNLGGQFWLQTKLDASAGWLGDSRSGAAILSGGPVLALGCGKSPVSLACGWSPTFITDHEFSSRNLGNLYQFTSYIGFNVDILSRVRLGYRLQHMSNGGFAHPNPGLNMHMFGVSYLF